MTQVSNPDIPGNLTISDSGFIARVHRIQKGRRDASTTKTLRDLAHERLLELEEHGDPAAIDTPAPVPQPAKSDAKAD